MSRRMMMMQNKVLNLFDKNSQDIIYHARLDNVGSIITGDEYGQECSFHTIYVSYR